MVAAINYQLTSSYFEYEQMSTGLGVLTVLNVVIVVVWEESIAQVLCLVDIAVICFLILRWHSGSQFICSLACYGK